MQRLYDATWDGGIAVHLTTVEVYGKRGIRTSLNAVSTDGLRTALSDCGVLRQATTELRHEQVSTGRGARPSYFTGISPQTVLPIVMAMCVTGPASDAPCR